MSRVYRKPVKSVRQRAV